MNEAFVEVQLSLKRCRKDRNNAWECQNVCYDAAEDAGTGGRTSQCIKRGYAMATGKQPPASHKHMKEIMSTVALTCKIVMGGIAGLADRRAFGRIAGRRRVVV